MEHFQNFEFQIPSKKKIEGGRHEQHKNRGKYNTTNLLLQINVCTMCKQTQDESPNLKHSHSLSVTNFTMANKSYTKIRNDCKLRKEIRDWILLRGLY